MVVVLPLENIGGDPEQVCFADTISTLWFFRRPADTERYRAAFRAAGLPED
ncbi:MAG TPA: hypothetical protein VJ779_00620 [Acetobacteraceae bacterium]|nr:hypothetical protein [Acetobacteraceae bacterium]